jgi:hypothetical protein
MRRISLYVLAVGVRGKLCSAESSVPNSLVSALDRHYLR